jgi:hypothetical protein
MQYLTQAEQNEVTKHISCFLRILKQCLKVKNEKLVIVSDYGKEGSHLALMLAYGYYLAAKKRKIDVDLVIQDVKKGFMQADAHVVKKIHDLPKGSVILVSVSNKLGRFGETKSFRGFCREQGHRFGTASGLGGAQSSHFKVFVEAMNINYARMQKMGAKIKKQWDKANTIRVTTPIGTDLKVTVTNMKSISNVADYQTPGSGGNIPAGEVYIAPVGEENVHGRVVLDGSIRHETGSALLKAPLTLTIEKGRVISIEGSQKEILERTFERFEDRAKYPERVRLIGELGIGINPGAVLMGIALMDEKVQGTAHIGIGSNSWFGGAIKTIFHGDMTFKNPTFYIDGKEMEL